MTTKIDGMKMHLGIAQGKIESVAPEADRKTLADIEEGKLSHCGIVRYSVGRERALGMGISPQELPPSYEKMEGEPGKHGWNSKQAREYLHRRGEL